MTMSFSATSVERRIEPGDQRTRRVLEQPRDAVPSADTVFDFGRVGTGKMMERSKSRYRLRNVRSAAICDGT